MRFTGARYITLLLPDCLSHCSGAGGGFDGKMTFFTHQTEKVAISPQATTMKTQPMVVMRRPSVYGMRARS